MKFQDYLGTEGNFVFFTGVVEDASDPLTLGRVKTRCHGFHTEDKTSIPTKDLPWATVLVQDNSKSPNLYKEGDWVMGFFADGKLAQYPVILGMIPGIARSGAPGEQGSSNDTGAPYHGQSQTTPGTNLNNSSTNGGNNIRDNGVKVNNQNKGSYPIEPYTWGSPPKGFACKDGSLDMHLPTAMAFVELSKQVSGGKLVINSAYRSPSYNARTRGAAKNSNHMQGIAIDVSRRSGMGDMFKFLELAAKNGFVGFGIYDTFVHIDTGNARVYRGGTSQVMAALKRGGWHPGKKALQGVKFDAATKTSANTASKNADGSQAADGTKAVNADGTTDPKSTQPSSSSSTSNPSTKQEVQQRITENLKGKGYNDVQVAGVLAHVERESSFNPNAVGDSGKAYGLFQWNDRQPAMRAWTQANGYNPNTVDGQLAFFHHEMGTSERKSFNQLSNATTPRDASIAMNSFERYRGSNNAFGTESLARIAAAEKYAGGATAKGELPGFHDPTNSYPLPNSRGQPTTHEAARGMNSTHSQNVRSGSRSTSAGGFPIAGNKGTFGAPASGVAPQYPHNKTYSTNSGHIMEFDDTPGAERTQITHKSGSYWSITANGSRIFSTLGNSYMFDAQNAYHGVSGNYTMSAVGDISMRSTSEITIQSDGSSTEMIYGDKSTSIAGKFDILVGGVLQIKAARVIIEADKIDVYSKGELNITSEGNLNINSQGKLALFGKGGVDINSGAAMALQSTGNTSVKAPQVAVDDIVKLASGDSVDAAKAKESASSDLGKAMTRKKIKKDSVPTQHPDAHVTTEQAASVYSGNAS